MTGIKAAWNSLLERSRAAQPQRAVHRSHSHGDYSARALIEAEMPLASNATNGGNSTGNGTLARPPPRRRPPPRASPPAVVVEQIIDTLDDSNKAVTWEIPKVGGACSGGG